MKKYSIVSACIGVALLAVGSSGVVGAVNNSTFNQSINSGTLVTDIKNASKVSVASPSVNMTAKTFSSVCLSSTNASTGTLGTDTERIYVTNPDAADGGWTLTMAATDGATSNWSSTYDFNDATGSGCTDGTDTDTYGGQLTVDPSAGTVTADCATCTNANITAGSSSAFSEGTLDSVTLLNAAATSDDIGEWYLTGVGLSQTIPANVPAGSYSINMTLTVASV